MQRVLASFAGLVLAFSVGTAVPALAQDDAWHTSYALIGTPKYPDNFPRFDYVNPDAPKGGTVRLSSMGGFDTFNPILDKGEGAGGLGLVYETLTTSSLDEISTEYGLLAEALKYPADYSSVTFRLRAEAKFQDGQPVTPDDVVWSLEQLKKLNPYYAQYYANVTKAEVTGEREVTFSFDQTGNRELPGIMGQLLVLPKHWWEGTDANGKQRNIAESTLEPPMGSGPYKLQSFEPGREVVYQRDPNYWGANLPVNIGSNNFDRYQIEYFVDLDIAFEAFKGDQFDYWLENAARRWATAYDIPQVQQGRITKTEYPQFYAGSGVMVAFIPNLRRPMFQDQRVREALNYAFDFETLKRTLFYDQYERINSFFYDTELSARGLPQGEELEILNAVKDGVPPEVFTTEYTNPVGGDNSKLRANLRTALGLLQQVGYTLKGNQLVDANGNQLSFEILLDGPTIEPVATAFVNNLKQIGINATIRTVDSAQFVNRTRSFDYDMIYQAWGQSLSPGNEQRSYWGSQSATEQGSHNYAGIADPAIDTLINKIIFADDRDTLVAATKALDRVLLAHHYVIPSYTLRFGRVAMWNRFSGPANLPEYSIGFPSIWWWDEAKAQQTGAPR